MTSSTTFTNKLRALAGASALSAATLGLTGAAEARDFRLLSGWDSSYVAVDVLTSFIETLDEAVTEGFGVNVMGPETVPPFEQFDPVSVQFAP